MPELLAQYLGMVTAGVLGRLHGQLDGHQYEPCVRDKQKESFAQAENAPQSREQRGDGHRPRNTRSPLGSGGAPTPRARPTGRAATGIEPTHRLTWDNGAYWPTP